MPHLAAESTLSTGSARVKGLQALRRRLTTFYKKHRVQSKLKAKKLTLLRGKKTKTTQLKAKAGATRALVSFSVDLARQFAGMDGLVGHHRYQCMEALATICHMAKQEKLTRDELTHWRQLAAEHMYHYASAGFSVKPKFHYFQHFPQHVERGGVPRTYWVYSDESKNKEVKGLWNAVSKGHSVYQQVLLRLEWWDELCSL